MCYACVYGRPEPGIAGRPLYLVREIGLSINPIFHAISIAFRQEKASLDSCSKRDWLGTNPARPIACNLGPIGFGRPRQVRASNAWQENDDIRVRARVW